MTDLIWIALPRERDGSWVPKGQATASRIQQRGLNW